MRRTSTAQQRDSTGPSTELSTGPHVHYEIRVNGKVVDPLTFVLPDGAIPD